ncbi:MAG: CAP domain-containing protein [Thermodesulfobacteriota bacterium]
MGSNKSIFFFILLLLIFSADSRSMEIENIGSGAMGYYLPEEQKETVSFFPLETEFISPSALSTNYPSEVIRLINLNRQNAGLLPVKFNSTLSALAQSHTERMRNTNCMAHQCDGEASPSERICGSGYRTYGGTQSVAGLSPASSGGLPNPGGGSCFVGEAIAGGYATPASLVSAWMASPSHYSILMHRQLREIGVGYAAGGYYRAYWTADLGSQPNSLPVFINYNAPDTGSSQVTLNITNEEVSGMGGIDFAPEVMIGNDPSFTGAGWQVYSPHKPWSLPQGSGQKIVYVKFRDPAGAELISCDDILLR